MGFLHSETIPQSNGWSRLLFSPGPRSRVARLAKTKPTNKNPKEKERGTENMGGEESKQPTSRKVILFKSNIFRNPIPGALCPKWLNTLQGDYLKHLWFEKNTSVSRPHPSVLRDSETSPKNATSKSKASVCTKSTGLQLLGNFTLGLNLSNSWD